MRIKLRQQWARFVSIAISLAVVVYAFQNCGEGFMPIEQSSLGSSSVQILMPPTTKQGYVGESVLIESFTKSESGITHTFQWKKNSQDIPGATSEILVLNNLQMSDAGLYSLAVTAHRGSDSSVTRETLAVPLRVMAAPLVSIAPQISTQTFSHHVPAGQASFARVEVSGYPKPSLQWFKDGEPIAGGNLSYLLFVNANREMDGVYWVEASNAAGSATTEPFLISVSEREVPPFIVNNTPNARVAVGQRMELRVDAVGVEAPAYQWRLNEQLMNFTGSRLVIEQARLADSGTYSVFAANKAGGVYATIPVTVIDSIRIVQGLVDQTIPVNAALNLTVTAQGVVDRYEWLKDGNVIAGANQATYSIPVALAADSGRYTVRLINIAGVVESSANVVVVPPPVLVTGLQNQTAEELQTARLNVSATGIGLTYAWFKDNVLIAGANDAELVIQQSTHLDVGNYRVDITNIAGSLSSNGFLSVNLVSDGLALYTRDCTACHGSIDVSAKYNRSALQIQNAIATVPQMQNVLLRGQLARLSAAQIAAISSALALSQPIIVDQPLSQAIFLGQALNLSVQAQGQYLRYQWFKNDVAITNATQPTFSIASVALSDAGNYRVTVTNGAGNVQSNVAAIQVLPAPTITTALTNQTSFVGQNVQLSVVASGQGLTYRWTKDGVALPDTTATLSINSVQLNQAGSYAVTVSNPAGSVTSTATLTVYGVPAITTAPTNATVPVGQSATFNVVATGQGLTYQWRKDGVNISGATAATLNFSVTAASQAGTYAVEVRNAAGSVFASANLVVITPPVITTALSNQSANVGQNVTFTGAASGLNLTYQWLFNNAVISGQTGTSLNLTNVQIAQAGNYTFRATNSAGSVTSTATLAVQATPVITTAPANVTVALGANATFSVVASGTGLSYQWQKNGVNISGATAATYTLTNVQATDAATYNVNVTNAAGTVSASAILSVIGLPTITTAPQNQTVAVGAAANFSVVATGTGLTYQWRKDGVNISGATAASYNIASVVAANAGNYTVVVTNVSGSVSASAALTVIGLPSITSAPQNQTAAVGGTANFSVVATGTSLSYQWQKDGVNISGATAANYSRSALQATDAGNYNVRVTNTAGTVQAQATLTVVALPTITTAPANLNLNSGQSATFSVVAAGSGLSYQWQRNGTNISGATAASYTIASVQASDAGTYTVVVTNIAGSVNRSAQLTVTGAPVITSAPQNLSVNVGQSATFTVVASGSGLSYQWQRNGANISGATAASYTIASVQAADAATYRVNVTNSAGTVNASATLSVTAAPTITTAPQNRSVAVGASTTFTVVASGSGLSYQWQRNGTNISGATAASYTIASVQAADAATYRVNVSNAAGTVNASATLTVITLPVITSGPSDLTLAVGQQAVFSVTASGTGLSYQWQRNGTNISGATAASYTIANVQSGDAATYRVNVSNAAGTVNDSATLTVVTAPVITTAPQNQTINVGQTLNLSVVASGTGLSYQWQRNSTNISGATAATYSLANAQTANAGTYTIRVTNLGGTVTANATVTVIAPPVITTAPTNRTITAGQSFSFTVTATGQNLSYQWQRNGTNISGATAATYSQATSAAADAGTYRVNVSNSAGTVSAQATLTVNAAINGATLYTNNCAGCHGALAVSAKRGRTAAQIQNSFAQFGFKTQAPYFFNLLSAAEVQAIANALNQ